MIEIENLVKILVDKEISVMIIKEEERIEEVYLIQIDIVEKDYSNQDSIVEKVVIKN